MGHGLTETDNVVLHERAAWHGLGLVIHGEAPTPRDGLTQGGIDWGVEQRVLFSYDAAGKIVEVPSHVGNYRVDTGSLLGVVSAGYQPIQNVEVADFCSALLEESQGIVRCESIGSIWGGKRIWFLLKGEAFGVANGDEMYPYVLVSNGHDGGATFRVTPTTIRVVCKNTLHGAIPEVETGQLRNSAISIRHTCNILERVEEARLALRHYGQTMDEQRKLVNILVARDVNQEAAQRFFLESYTEDFGEIPDNPQNKVEQNRRDKATSAYASFSKRFDDERPLAGANMWNVFNAYSGLVQHDQKARGKDDAARVGRRIESNLFGLNQDRTQSALKRAFKVALGV